MGEQTVAMGGLKRGYRYPHCIAQNSRPSDPPGGSAFTAQIEEGKGGMTGLLVHPLSPKVIFISAVQSLEVATA